MLFKSNKVKAQWDTWAYYNNNTYYLYYLITEESPGEGFGVATSEDGVHWKDHGWAISQSDKNVYYLGTGYVWKHSDFEENGKFICNYSEHRKEDNGKITQNILFAWSNDLIHWNKFGDESIFKVDNRFYDKYGRWDCIFAIPRTKGGYWGTWTATAHPDSKKKGIVGIGYSEDGVSWTALKPPIVEPGVGESGAFYQFGDKIYAMFGAGGMWSYSADKVTGPYFRARKNALLLNRGHTYFSRFFITPDEVLVNHHSMSGKMHGNRPITYAAPLKLAVIDNEGVLRFKYWKGNDKLKGELVKLKPETLSSSIVSFITEPLDFTKGIIAEGSLSLPEDDNNKPVGLYVYVDNQGYAIRVMSDGKTEMGLMDLFGNYWKVQQHVNRECKFGETVKFRLLMRRGMLEFYLDDHFMECYTMGCPDGQIARIGVFGNIDDDSFSQLKVWRMSLSSNE